MTDPARPSLKPALAVALLAAITHLPALRNGFVNFDDVFTILHNPLVTDPTPANLRAVWTGFAFGNYQPLTVLSLALDHALAGPDPRWFHGVNVLLHAVNAGLVTLLARRVLRDEAAALLAGALFAVHPLHVESVAWASQRKDVLFVALGLAAALAWLRRADGGGRRWTVAAAGLFAAACLAKATAVTLAAVLPLLAWFTAGREGWRRVRGGTAVLAGLALGFGALAVAAQRSSDFVVAAGRHPLAERVQAAGTGFVTYLGKFVAPVRQSAFYPWPEGGLPATAWLAVAGMLLVLAVTAALLRRRHAAGLGLAIYALTVAPMLQLLPIGSFLLAERFTYLPGVGVMLAAGAGFAELRGRRPRWSRGLAVGGVLLVLGSTAVLVPRLGVWRDSVTLWNDVLARYPDAWLALNNRGIALAEAGDAEAAVRDFDDALRLNPTYVDALVNRGAAKLQAGRLEAALADLVRAARMQPGHPQVGGLLTEARYRRALRSLEAGDREAAVRDLELVLRADPDRPGAREALARARR